MPMDPPPPPNDMPWPKPPTGHPHPTPYQILSTTEAEPYSKRRFYELVKLYHPDSGACEKHHHHHNVPQALRLERYRLVVAAHTILSDPNRRSMYNRFGAGWTGLPSTVGGKPAPGTPAGPFSGWRHQSDPDIWANATWEDWERFYARRDGKPTQSPRYLSNGNFVLCVFLLATIGAGLNLSRAEVEGEKFVASRDMVHDRASKDLRRVRQMSENRPKEERIQFFLRQREATMHGIGVESLRDDQAAKLLPEQETCLGSDDQNSAAGGRGS
jgi:curved DNA-binding protein CbpA